MTRLDVVRALTTTGYSLKQAAEAVRIVLDGSPWSETPWGATAPEDAEARARALLGRQVAVDDHPLLQRLKLTDDFGRVGSAFDTDLDQGYRIGRDEAYFTARAWLYARGEVFFPERA